MSVERKVSVEITPLAERDAEAITLQITAEQPEAAYRFVAAIQSVRDLLSMFPNAGRAFEQRPLRKLRLRRYTVPGFRNHLILYVVAENAVLITAVVHGARNLAAEIADWPPERYNR